MNQNLNQNNNKKGFAMLFAVLTASLLVTIGISIFSVSFKELMLSASMRDSQLAYYASESAYECFKYWSLFDTSKRAFSPIEYDLLGAPSYKEDNTSQEIICNNNKKDITLTRASITDGDFAGGYSYSYYTEPFFKYSTLGTDDIQPEAGFSFVIQAKQTGISYFSTEQTLVFFGHNTGESGRRVERKYQITE